MRLSPRLARPRSRTRGFTLIELMAALVAGLVAISAIYAVSSGSAKHFHEQQRIAQTQMSLRMAMAQLRADIQRAGLFGTGSSATANPPNLRNCPVSQTRVAAIEQLDREDDGVFDELIEANEGIQFDRVRLVGNYATTGAYLMIGATSPMQIRLQTTSQGFRRDFASLVGSEWQTNIANGGPLRQAFRAGRMVHVRTLQETSFFSPIASVATPSTDQVFVNLTDPMPTGSPCIPGLADGATVAPLSRIEYAVVDPNTEDELEPMRAADATTEAVLGLTPSVLVRREIAFGAGAAVIAGTTRVVLEYAVDFDVDLVVNTAADGMPPVLEVRDGAQAEAFAAATPEDVHGVIVRLSARTPGTTPNFAPPADGAGGPLTRFVVPGAPAGSAARVRTVETEIFLPNVRLN